MMLRRLVQLEPELFRDMRYEILEEIAIMEQRFESGHHNKNSSSFLKHHLSELLKKISHSNTQKQSHDMIDDDKMIPLSTISAASSGGV